MVLLFYRKQHKKLAALEMELAAAQQEDFASKNLLENKGTPLKKRLLAVVRIITKFGHKNNRDAIHRAWMPTSRIPFFCKFRSLFFV